MVLWGVCEARTMTEPITLDADVYHTLSGTDRDHLLAAAMLNAERDTIPPAAAVTTTVGRFTGDTPTSNTTRSSLDRLESAGLIERVDGEPNNRSRGVCITDEGKRVLERGAARLDAAATVE